MNEENWMRTPIEPQSVDAPLSRSAVFLVLLVARNDDGSVVDGALDTIRDVLGDLGGLVRTVGFRDLAGHLSCVAGIGSDVWDDLLRLPRPAQLKPFVTKTGPVHTAPSTPGDLLFHIRAEREDMCFEFERILLSKLGAAVTVADETSAFRSFDSRDLLGFVDGTENPTGAGMAHWAVAGPDDPAAEGGSYVVVQKYLHDLTAWESLPVEVQERVIGRTKLDNIELDDVEGSGKAHKTLTTIVDDDGVEHDILRDNMPFGRPGHAEFGTYFIGYSRDLWVIERMLDAMFLGDPIGSYDRMLDFSTPVTGSTFFAPSNDVLEALGD